METHFSYSKKEFKKHFGRKFRLANILLIIAILLEVVFGILRRNHVLNFGEAMTSKQEFFLDLILAIFFLGAAMLVFRYVSLNIFAKYTTLVYNNGMIKYLTRHSSGQCASTYRHYYIDNIHSITDEGAYLIVYGNIRKVDISVSYMSEKQTNKVKILKCFDGLEDFLTEMGYMNSSEQ